MLVFCGCLGGCGFVLWLLCSCSLFFLLFWLVWIIRAIGNGIGCEWFFGQILGKKSTEVDFLVRGVGTSRLSVRCVVQEISKMRGCVVEG